jgi:RimJ/RimL family protein N-acetyltransferase
MTDTSKRTLNRAAVAAPSGAAPARTPLEGSHARLEPLSPATHGAELYRLSHAPEATADLWDYLPYGPFPAQADFTSYLEGCAASDDPLFFALCNLSSGRAEGVASYLNIVPKNASIEIGHIWLAPCLQQTRAATEALYLMMRPAVGDLGSRRLEWKCNALNEASRRAALRLGFTFEGIFYQHMLVKGHNRDTAWYSILDGEWPAIDAAFKAWLAPENFDAQGRQRQSLALTTAPLGH